MSENQSNALQKQWTNQGLDSQGQPRNKILLYQKKPQGTESQIKNNPNSLIPGISGLQESSAVSSVSNTVFGTLTNPHDPMTRLRS